MAAQIEFFYDFSCPYAYLGSARIEALCEGVGAELVWRPILLGGLFRTLYDGQTAPPPPIAPKAAHAAADLRRWAEYLDVPLAYPPGHPVRTVDALRSVLANPGLEAALSHRFYRAYWVEHLDIGTPDVLRQCLEEVGIDPETTMDRIGADIIRNRLRAHTEEAGQRGVFGVPTCIINGDTLIWGQDRLPFVEAFAKEH